MAIVKIPTPLRNLTENKTEIQINGRTIIEIIENLDSMKSKLAFLLLSVFIIYEDQTHLFNGVNIDAYI